MYVVSSRIEANGTAAPPPGFPGGFAPPAGFPGAAGFAPPPGFPGAPPPGFNPPPRR